MNREQVSYLTIRTHKACLKSLAGVLQSRFMIWAHTGISIRDFLIKQCSIKSDYISDVISTIFLDSKPVDDIDAAYIRPGSVLAISGSMPGLMGALMRSGSSYSSLRSSITHDENKDSVELGEGFVTLKLFNTVMNDLGPDFLRMGIVLSLEILCEFLKMNAVNLQSECEEIIYNGIILETGVEEKLNKSDFGHVLLKAEILP